MTIKIIICAELDNINVSGAELDKVTVSGAKLDKVTVSGVEQVSGSMLYLLSGQQIKDEVSKSVSRQHPVFVHINCSHSTSATFCKKCSHHPPTHLHQEYSELFILIEYRLPLQQILVIN